MKKYYYISTKWTHKTDGYITLWRHNANGYCWRKDWSGSFESPDKEYGVVAVDVDIVDKLWQKAIYDNQDIEVLYNDSKTLKALGLKVSDFMRMHPSDCIRKSKLKTP